MTDKINSTTTAGGQYCPFIFIFCNSLIRRERGVINQVSVNDHGHIINQVFERPLSNRKKKYTSFCFYLKGKNVKLLFMKKKKNIKLNKCTY